MSKLVAFFTMTILLIAGAANNLSAQAILMPSSVNQWLQSIAWVGFSIGVVIAAFLSFTYSWASKVLLAFGFILMSLSCALSFNAVERNVAGYQAAGYMRESLLAEKNDILSALPECRLQAWCVSADKEYRLEQINSHLASLPLATNNSSYASKALPYIMGFGPDIAGAAVAIVFGLLVGKKKESKPEIDTKKESTTSGGNVFPFKKKLKSIISKFPKLKNIRPVGNSTKKSGNPSGNRKRTCTKEDIKNIQLAKNEFISTYKRNPKVSELAKAAGVHVQKVSDFNNRMRAKESKA